MFYSSAFRTIMLFYFTKKKRKKKGELSHLAYLQNIGKVVTYSTNEKATVPKSAPATLSLVLFFSLVLLFLTVCGSRCCHLGMSLVNKTTCNQSQHFSNRFIPYGMVCTRTENSLCAGSALNECNTVPQPYKQ